MTALQFEKPITDLRRRMLQDMTNRNLRHRTVTVAIEGRPDQVPPGQEYSFIKRDLAQSSVQTRYQATQSYNAATGAASNESKLWATPNGAVVNWSGGVVAPAPSSKDQK